MQLLDEDHVLRSRQRIDVRYASDQTGRSARRSWRLVVSRVVRAERQVFDVIGATACRRERDRHLGIDVGARDIVLDRPHLGIGQFIDQIAPAGRRHAADRRDRTAAGLGQGNGLP